MAEKSIVERSPFVERVPELRNRKWGGMDAKASRVLVDDILKGGAPAVQGLVDGLREVDDGSDWQERLLIYQLVTQTNGPERERERGVVMEVLIESARGNRPAPVRTFLLHQVRIGATAEAAPRLAPILREEDPQLLDAVTAVMVSMGEGARQTLEKARQGAEGHAKVAIEHALHQLMAGRE